MYRYAPFHIVSLPDLSVSDPQAQAAPPSMTFASQKSHLHERLSEKRRDNKQIKTQSKSSLYTQYNLSWELVLFTIELYLPVLNSFSMAWRSQTGCRSL